MKKSTFKNKRTLQKILRAPRKIDRSEKAIDTDTLDQEVPEEFREAMPNSLPAEELNANNWSEAQDRSEDLANMQDYFIQQPERDTETPPELAQHGGTDVVDREEDLARRFEAERQTGHSI